MKAKKVVAIIEASKTGYSVYVEDDALPLTGYGKTIDAAKKDLQSVLKEMMVYFKEKGEAPPKAYNNGNLEFVYKYDIASIFEYFGALDVSQFAARIKMNPSLLRQYKGKHAVAGEKAKKKIEEGLHELGRELLAVRL